MERVQAEMKMALGFAKTLLEMGKSFNPLVLVMKGSDNLFIGSPPDTDEEHKATATSMMAMAARAWGGEQVIFVCDAFFARYDDKPDLDDVPMPSEDPKASEAILVHAFRTDQPDLGYLMPYHHTPEGIQFDKEEELPIGGPGESEDGMVPHVFHNALRMTDEQVAEVLSRAPVEGGVASARELLLLMTGMGFMVMSDG